MSGTLETHLTIKELEKMLNKILYFYITFAVMFKLGTTPIAHSLYIIWLVLAGLWALFNLIGLLSDFTKEGKVDKRALEATGLKPKHVKRGLWVTFIQIVMFIIFNEPVMALSFLLFVVPFLMRILNLLEPNNKK